MITQLRQYTRTLVASAGTRQGAFMAAAAVVAGGFDYVTNVVVGRFVVDEYAIFLAVTALLHVAVQLTNVIRNVVAFYTAELSVLPRAALQVGLFLRRRWRWAWKWGALATAVMAALCVPIARLLGIGRPWPVLAGSLTLLLLFLRPVTDGTLQGVQNFLGLGGVQITQSVLRLGLVIVLVWAGLRATGAILALPLAMAGALLLALWLLRPYFGATTAAAANPEPARTISWQYSTQTMVGLLAYAVLINLDPIVVQRSFSAALAQSYSPVVTLGKMNLFIPLGIGLVLFPKATQRRAVGRDARPVLLLALVGTLLPGIALTLLYFLFPAQIVQIVFTDAYTNPGVVLGLVGLATTLFAGVNIWLNYALSTEQYRYVLLLVIIVVLHVAVMLFYHPSLTAVAATMVASGLTANLAGVLAVIRNP